MASVTPDPTSNNSNIYLVPVTISAGIALILTILRIWTRVTRTKKLFLDDWFIVVAEPLSLINVFLGCAAVAHGWGRQYATLNPKEIVTTLKLEFAVQTTWIFTLCFVRLSVACSLLRFGTDKLWRFTLYGLMGLQVLISMSWIIIQFGQCKPVSSNWQYVPDVTCWDVNAIVDYGWAIAAVYIVMDLILSLMPIRLIVTLHRSTSEKILICFLMALGLLATGVACGKMTTFVGFGSGDPMQATIKPSMYAKLEEIVGIIASCLPCLKSPAEKLLHKLGILKEHQLSRPSFVQQMSMPDLPYQPNEGDPRSSGEGSFPTAGKHEPRVRIDSVGFLPGSSDSNKKPVTDQTKQDWDVV